MLPMLSSLEWQLLNSLQVHDLSSLDSMALSLPFLHKLEILLYLLPIFLELLTALLYLLPTVSAEETMFLLSAQLFCLSLPLLSPLMIS